MQKTENSIILFHRLSVYRCGPAIHPTRIDLLYKRWKWNPIFQQFFLGHLIDLSKPIWLAAVQAMNFFFLQTELGSGKPNATCKPSRKRTATTSTRWQQCITNYRHLKWRPSAGPALMAIIVCLLPASWVVLRRELRLPVLEATIHCDQRDQGLVRSRAATTVGL